MPFFHWLLQHSALVLQPGKQHRVITLLAGVMNSGKKTCHSL